MAMAFDHTHPRLRHNTVNTMRLWCAKSRREFDLKFQRRELHPGRGKEDDDGKHLQGSSTPATTCWKGRNLRFKQEYFLASATVHDVIYRFKKKTRRPDAPAGQGGYPVWNDTHRPWPFLS